MMMPSRCLDNMIVRKPQSIAKSDPIEWLFLSFRHPSRSHASLYRSMKTTYLQVSFPIDRTYWTWAVQRDQAYRSLLLWNCSLILSWWNTKRIRQSNLNSNEVWWPVRRIVVMISSVGVHRWIKGKCYVSTSSTYLEYGSIRSRVDWCNLSSAVSSSSYHTTENNWSIEQVCPSSDRLDSREEFESKRNSQSTGHWTGSEQSCTRD